MNEITPNKILLPPKPQGWIHGAVGSAVVLIVSAVAMGVILGTGLTIGQTVGQIMMSNSPQIIAWGSIGSTALLTFAISSIRAFIVRQQFNRDYSQALERGREIEQLTNIEPPTWIIPPEDSSTEIVENIELLTVENIEPQIVEDVTEQLINLLEPLVEVSTQCIVSLVQAHRRSQGKTLSDKTINTITKSIQAVWKLICDILNDDNFLPNTLLQLKSYIESKRDLTDENQTLTQLLEYAFGLACNKINKNEDSILTDDNIETLIQSYNYFQQQAEKIDESPEGFTKALKSLVFKVLTIPLSVKTDVLANVIREFYNSEDLANARTPMKAIGPNTPLIAIKGVLKHSIRSQFPIDKGIEKRLLDDTILKLVPILVPVLYDGTSEKRKFALALRAIIESDHFLEIDEDSQEQCITELTPIISEKLKGEFDQFF